MLPEVNRRRLYEKEGCSSVVEFAKKVGGVSEEQVRRVLHVEEDLRDKPQLHQLLVSGEVSINKLAKIHTVATPDNQELLANQVQMLSARAVETLARDIRHMQQVVTPSNKISFRHVPELASYKNLALSEEVEGRLLELQRRGIDINQLLTELLDQREQEIEQEKDEIAHELATQEEPQTRYIPARTKKILEKEHGNICSRTGCNKPAADIHHEKRWGVDPTNDPRYLSPLCEEHHEIAHTIDVKYQEKKRGRK